MAIQGTWREPKPEEHDPILKQRARLRDFYDKEREGYETAVRTVVGERYTPPEKREHSLLGEAARGVARGVVGLAQVVPETAEFALSDVLGIKPVEKVTRPVIEKLEEVQRGPALRPSESVAGVSVMDEPTQLKNLNWWAANVPEAAVSIAGFFIPGAIAGRAAKIVKYGKMLKEAKVAGDTARVAQITSRIAKISQRSAIASGMALEAAGARQRLRQFEQEHPEKSVSWGNRLLTIIGTGVVAGSLEALSIERVFGGKAGKSLIGKIIDSIAVEGGTEGAQEVVANAFQKAGYDPDQSLVQGVVDSIVIGGALGAFGGGAEYKYEKMRGEKKPSTIAERMLGTLKRAEVISPMPTGTDAVTDLAGPRLHVPTRMPSEAPEGPAVEPTAGFDVMGRLRKQQQKELKRGEVKELRDKLRAGILGAMGLRQKVEAQLEAGFDVMERLRQEQARVARTEEAISKRKELRTGILEAMGAARPGPVTGEAISEVMPEVEPEKVVEREKPITLNKQAEILNLEPTTGGHTKELDTEIETFLDMATEGSLEDKKFAFDFLTKQRPDIGRHYFQLTDKGRDVIPIELVTESILEELGALDISPEDEARVRDNPELFPELYDTIVEEEVPVEAPPIEEVVAPEVPPEEVGPPAGVEAIPEVEEVLAEERPPEEEVELPTEFVPEEEIPKPEQAGLANRVEAVLLEGNTLKSKDLQQLADEAFGGTQAEGQYTPKDMYDAMELGVNMYVLDNVRNIDPTIENADVASNITKNLKKLIAKLPTQTRRTEEMGEFQQFSTPPPLAYLANWVANLQKDDTYLEPSAGIGGLAVFAKNAEVANIIVNELSPRRLELLKKALPDAQTFTEDGAQLYNILHDTVSPTVVVMNPPFSATAGRVQGRRATVEGAKHVEQSLKLLLTNGRLVAIVGKGMATDKPAFSDWWKKIKSEYNVRADIGIPGKEYAKYGTTFDNRLLVIDKTGPTPEDGTLVQDVDSIEAAIPILKEIRDERTHPGKRAPAEPTGEEVTPEGERRRRRPGEPIQPPTGRVGREEERAVGAGERGRGERIEGKPGQPAVRVEPKGGVEVSHIERRRRGERPAVVAGEQERPERPVPSGKHPTRTAAPGPKRPAAGVSPAERVEITKPAEVIELEAKAQEAKGELTEDIYEAYTPERITIPNSKPHPTKLVQSAAMAAVSPPEPTYKPKLPKDIVETGKLSDIQLEAVVYAGQSHQEKLPDGRRRGFFIGDGTGVGKGREIAGILLDNWNKGHKKAVWISENKDLLKDARRDIKGIGWDPNLLFSLNRVKARGNILQGQGIAFGGYHLLGKSLTRIEGNRLNQLVNWLGKDFDGVIVFDESHNMSNVESERKARGKTKPAQKALAGVALQDALPNAKVVYVSATGAQDVRNLAYCTRLGLWGEGTPFADVKRFIGRIKQGGIAAMEMVSRDMKSMGVYISRSLAYDGVEHDTLQHKLTPDQRKIYNDFTGAWQIILQNIEDALKATNSGSQQRQSANSQFWNAHQRFFNQIITSMQAPTVIQSIKKDIERGDSVVLQLVNTLEATQERAIARLTEEETLEDLDLTPRDIIMQYLEASFPVQEIEDYTDEHGHEKKRPVVDSKGNPVLNKQAVAMRNELLNRLGSYKFPESPLDMIINYFGVDQVAEITGRKRRVIEREGKRVLDKRSERKVHNDLLEFNDNKKHILLFSEKGGTGQSYHADLDIKNQQRRVHYLFQPGWRATKAMQGLGRTHRSNQKQPPKYVLCTTDLKGQVRFISSIARRLDQLGALTKGERKTGSQGIFSAKDNLENQYAQTALRQFYRDLALNQIPDLTPQEYQDQTALTILTEQGGPVASPPSMKEFMNRLLNMNINTQNKVFDEFSKRQDDIVEMHIREGTLDQGLETLKGKKIEKIGEETVHVDEKSGAETRYIQLDITNPAVLYSWQEARKDSDRFYYNKRSGQVWNAREYTRTDPETGRIVNKYFMVSPVYGRQMLSQEEISSNPNWVRIDEHDAKRKWQGSIDLAPKELTTRYHLITGTLLPIWDRLIGHPRIIRAQTDKGERMIGRLINEGDLAQTLKNLGATAAKVKITPEEIYSNVLDRGFTIALANNWRIIRRRVANENRIELKGLEYADFRLLEHHGVFSERIKYDTRYFIPIKRDAALNAIRAVIKDRPVVSVEAPGEVAAEPSDEGIQQFNDSLSSELVKDLKTFGTKISRILGKIPEKTRTPSLIPGIPRPVFGIKTLGVGIRADLVEKKTVNLKGKRVKSAEDVAVMCQVYRDPRFETLRVIYIKDNKIVHHEGLSSRMPGFAEWRPQDTENLRENMAKFKADGYYLVHNHPSGQVKPSEGDLRTTAEITRDVPGLFSHIIIDGGTYCVLDRIGKTPKGKVQFWHNYRMVPKLPRGWKDPLLTPALPHEFVGLEITSSEQIIPIARNLNVEQDYVTLLYLDQQSRVRLIQEMPNRIFGQTDRATKYIKVRAQSYGAPMVIAHVSSSKDLTYPKMEALINNGTLIDVVTSVGTLPGGPGIIPEKQAGNLMFGVPYEKLKTLRVQEETKQPRTMRQALRELGITGVIEKEDMPKRARSIGLAYQDIDQEAKEIEVALGREYPKSTRTHEELRTNADKIIADPEALLKVLNKKGNFTEDEGLVIRRVNAMALEKLLGIMEVEDLDEANRMLTLYQETIGKKTQDLHSQFGRQLESLKEIVGPDAMAKAFANLERELTQEDRERFNAANEAWQLGNHKPMLAFMKYLKKTKTNPKIIDYVTEYWYNAILSGIPTHVINVASNTAWAAWQIGVHRPLLAAIDPIVARFQKRSREHYFDEIVPMMAGIKKGFLPGAQAAKEVIQRGYTTRTMDKWEIDIGRAIGAFARSPNKWLCMISPVLTMPTRALRAMDVWANQMNFQAELHAIAKRLEKQGKGKFEDLLKNPTPAMIDEAAEYARYTTFMNAPGKITQWILAGREKIPGARFVIPFVNTIANLTKRGVEMTPGLGLALGHRALGKTTGTAMTQLIAKQIEGAIITACLAGLLAAGRITGDVPEDKAEREAFYRQGKLPWAIYIGGKWRQYRRVEPFNTPIASMAIMYDRFTRDNEEPSTEMVASAMASVINNILDSSYLSGLTGVLDAIRKADKTPQKVTNILDRTLASFSPMSSFQRSFVRAVEARAGEGAIVRKPRGILETLFAATPFISEKVAPRKNIWGEAVTIPGSPIEQWLPWKAAEVTEDPVEVEIEKLARAGVLAYPGMPQQFVSIKGKRYDLDDKQYDNLITQAGKAAKKRLNQIVRAAYWKNLPNERKASIISKTIQLERKRVRDKIKTAFRTGTTTRVLGLTLRSKKKETTKRPYAVLGF